MATVPSLKVTKTMPFKGGTREFSNRYHFVGGIPSDDAAWHALMDVVVTAEHASLSAPTTIVLVEGYLAGSEVPVSQKVYSTVGTLLPATGGTACPGECAVLVRYSTSARSVKNHPIYLFNYYHHVLVNGSTSLTIDSVDSNQKATLEGYAGAWVTGLTAGGLTVKRSSPSGAVAIGHLVEEYVTHRDFPYTTSV